MQRARFGVFEVGLHDGSLRKRGHLIRLQDKPFQALALLLGHAGEVVTREQFRVRLWTPGTFGELDDNLNAAIKRLREVLGDSAESPRFIETVPRRGYRFIASVEMENDPPPEVGGESLTARRASAFFVLALLTLSVTASGRRNVVDAYPPRLRVLPFGNHASAGEQFFANGMHEDVTGQLRRLRPRALAVIAGNGDRGADFLVRGEVDGKEQSLSTTVALLRAEDHVSLWTGTFRSPIQDVFIATEVARAVATTLRLKIPPPERPELSRALTVDGGAYRSYLHGMYELHRGTDSSLTAAIAWFERSLRADPYYATPYAGLARSYLAAGRLHFMAAQASVDGARAALDRGMRLDPAIADLHLLVADMASRETGNHEAVEREYRRAIELDPNSIEAHEHYALYLRERRPLEALVEIEKARDLDPKSPWLNACAGWVLIANGRLDEASVQLHHALALDPRMPNTMRFLANLEMRRGRMNAAILWFERAADASGREPFFVYRLGLAYARTGSEARVRRLLEELQSDAAHRYVEPEFIRSLQSALGG